MVVPSLEWRCLALLPESLSSSQGALYKDPLSQIYHTDTILIVTLGLAWDETFMVGNIRTSVWVRFHRFRPPPASLIWLEIL